MRQRTIYNILFILLVSCTSELPVTPDLEQGQEQGVPVQFSVSIESEPDENSRSAIETPYLPDNEEVGIYALKGTLQNEEFTVTGNTREGWEWDETNIQTNFSNAKYIAYNYTDPEDPNQITYHQLLPAQGTVTGKFPSVDNGALRFYAYYPYDADVTVGTDGQGTGRPIAPQINIKIGNSIEDTNDYMYTGPIDVSALQTEPVNLPLKHALGRLNILVHTEQPTGNWREYPYVKSITVETFKSQEGVMNLETGEITPGNMKLYTFTQNFESDDYYYIMYSKSSPKLSPIYSNLFIPNIVNQTNFLYRIKLSIVNSECDED